MLDWIRRVLGAPRPIIIEFDGSVLDGAATGSLVIVRTRQHLTGTTRAMAGEFFAGLRDRYPGLRFLILDAEFDVIVLPPVGNLTTSKSGPQQ